MNVKYFLAGKSCSLVLWFYQMHNTGLECSIFVSVHALWGFESTCRVDLVLVMLLSPHNILLFFFLGHLLFV